MIYLESLTFKSSEILISIEIFILGIITGALIIFLPITGKLAKIEAQNTRLKREIKQLKSESRDLLNCKKLAS